MHSSDSEDFESADEGHTSHEKKERRKRNSSSNYSDNLESDQEFKTPNKVPVPKAIAEKPQTDGWDDFEIEEPEPITSTSPIQNKDNASSQVNQKTDNLPSEISQKKDNESSKTSKVENVKSQDTGWDDFGDWGDDASTDVKQEQPKHPQVQPERDIKEVTDRLAAASMGPGGPASSPGGSGWGWGWSVDTLLSTASAGFTNITSQVSQGISTVLETGIGAPDPEELARKTAKDNELKEKTPEDQPVTSNVEEVKTGSGAGGDAFQFGNLFSGVTKFVESTGTKVLAGGLDTLETIGKKTMEVLQDGDPGLAKKRAMFGLDPGDKVILSQVLREAKDKADEEDKIREEKKEAKQVHYETLFDDFEGLVHLEALEMLSRQVSMRIDERLKAADPEKRQDIKETLQQVAELCEMPEDDDDEEDTPQDVNKAEAFHERLQTATQDLGLKLQFQPLVKQYTEVLDWLSTTTELTDKAIYKRCVSSLAHTTALSVQAYHKAGELLLTKQRRSTADEADALTQMTVVLTKHISELATLFTEKMNSIPTDNKEQINTYITNIFLEAGNSSTYIQNAFQLALPILQIGAV